MEGPTSVEELLLHRPEKVQDVYFVEDLASQRPELVALANQATKWVHVTTTEVMRALSADSQGVVAVVSMSAVVWPGELPEFLSSFGGGYLAYLPELQDPGNMGTVIRSADAFGASAVVVGKGSVELTSPKVIRSSAGSVFHLPLVLAGGETSTFADFRRAGVPIFGADMAGETSLVDPRFINSELTRTHVWMFGNEARGLSATQQAECSRIVSIPMTGASESLNAASAATLCLYSSQQARADKA